MVLIAEEKLDLNLDELSLLLLTNDGMGPLPQKYSNENIFVLTTKETYIWGIILSRIVQKNDEIDEKRVLSAFRTAIRQNKRIIQKYYSESNYLPRYSHHFYVNDEILFRIIRSMSKELRVTLNMSEIDGALRSAFNSMVKRRYIEDPVFTSIFGLSVAIVGFIPYGFTKQTRKGRTVHRKITAAFWSYEKRETSKDNVKTDINFRLWKVVTAFKKALAETTDEETNNK